MKTSVGHLKTYSLVLELSTIAQKRPNVAQVLTKFPENP